MENMKYTTGMFYYDKATKTFTQEASTLRIPSGQYPSRITLQNPKTMGLCVFEFLGTTTDRGDITSFEYISIAGASGLKLTVWND